jgi:hypothetical protein
MWHADFSTRWCLYSGWHRRPTGKHRLNGRLQADAAVHVCPLHTLCGASTYLLLPSQALALQPTTTSACACTHRKFLKLPMPDGTRTHALHVHACRLLQPRTKRCLLLLALLLLPYQPWAMALACKMQIHRARALRLVARPKLSKHASGQIMGAHQIKGTPMWLTPLSS